MKRILTDDQIDGAFKGTDFGLRDERKLLEQGVLKVQAGYRCGHTLMTIMRELGLISMTGVLKKGRKLIFGAFYDDQNTG